MQLVTFKLQEDILKKIDSVLRPMRYNNRTEFIREAIRDKLWQIEKEKALKNLEKYFGYGRKIKGRQTTAEEERIAGELAFKKIAEKHGIKLD